MPNERIPDRHLDGWDMDIKRCTLDASARRELLDYRRKRLVITDCYIVKRDSFWRFVAIRAFRAAAHYLTFGTVTK